MTGDPLTVINPAALPVDPRTCRPIDPNRYLKVNTIFNVARAHGLRTAWSDKHPAYQVLSGPPGTGVPAIFGMNFQAVSTAEKLPSSDGLTGGYLPGGRVPGPLLTRALNYVDGKVGLMVAQLRR
jgi:hypothetical protein